MAAIYLLVEVINKTVKILSDSKKQTKWFLQYCMIINVGIQAWGKSNDHDILSFNDPA